MSTAERGLANPWLNLIEEDKAKVVAAVWGTIDPGSELIKFLAALALLHQDDSKNRMNSSFSSYHPGAINLFLHTILVQFILVFISSWCKIACAARNWINSVPQTAALCILFCINPYSMIWDMFFLRTATCNSIICRRKIQTVESNVVYVSKNSYWKWQCHEICWQIFSTLVEPTWAPV